MPPLQHPIRSLKSVALLGWIRSISVRGIDYLVATRRLPFRKIGGRVLIPVAELRKYANGDHPERIVA